MKSGRIALALALAALTLQPMHPLAQGSAPRDPATDKDVLGNQRRETGLTIAEIATDVGFSDQNYFDKRFKRAFGRTPREFRLGWSGQNPPRI